MLEGEVQVNESLLTGESDEITKRPGDELMSGSFVNAGIVLARVVHVGAENYAAKISAEAKQHKAVNSEIMNSLNRIIRFVSFVIFPLGALLFARQHFLGGVETNGAILSTVSALVGMIPEGLILLTSTVLAVAVVRLAKSKVLVQQLYCIETLARVDTLCLDKTGTITTGKMEVEAVCPVKGVGQDAVDAAGGFADGAARDGACRSLVHGLHLLHDGPGQLGQALGVQAFHRPVERYHPRHRDSRAAGGRHSVFRPAARGERLQYPDGVFRLAPVPDHLH